MFLSLMSYEIATGAWDLFCNIGAKESDSKQLQNVQGFHRRPRSESGIIESSIMRNHHRNESHSQGAFYALRRKVIMSQIQNSTESKREFLPLRIDSPYRSFSIYIIKTPMNSKFSYLRCHFTHNPEKLYDAMFRGLTPFWNIWSISSKVLPLSSGI